MAMAIEDCVALAARDGPIVPGFASQIGSLDGLAGLRWFVVAVVASLHGVTAVAGGIGTVAAGCIAVASIAAGIAIGRG